MPRPAPDAGEEDLIRVIPAPAVGPAPGAGSILIADQSVCKPDQAAGDRTVLSIIVAFREAGWAVTYWAYDRCHGGSYTSDMEALGVSVLDARWRDGITAWLERFGSSLNHVMLMRPRVARDLLPDLLRTVTCQISYYGHDLHFARFSQQANLLNDPLLAYSAERYLALERRVWRVVDVVLYPSEDEVAEVRRLEPDVDARVLTPFTFASFLKRSKPTPGSMILFVGGFAHAPNEDAAVWFATEVLPLIHRSNPAARFVVVGSKPTPRVQALSAGRVEVTGQIDDAALAAAYAAARVVIAPLRVGAGVKGKVVEALAHGVPVVTSTVGAQGLPGLDAFAPVCDDAQGVACAVLLLLEDDDRWLRQSTAETEYSRRHFSRAALTDSLFAMIGDR